MRRLKHLRILSPDSDEFGNIEEAPVVDALARSPPESELVRLLVQEIVQGVEAGRIALDSVKAS